LKKIIFLIIASLLVVGLILPGMVGGANPTIEIIIAGPMEYIQGQDMMAGAELAADEINTAGGVSVTGGPYDIVLHEVETDEIDNYAEAGIKLQDAIDTYPNAQYIIGGFRTEGVDNMLPVAGGNNVTMIICGSASYKSLSAMPYAYVVPALRYLQYCFRGTPFNDVFLLNNSFMMMGMVAVALQAEGVSPRVAIFAESLDWADPIVASAQLLIPAFGWSVGEIARVSDKASSTIVDPALNAIEADEDNMIWTVMSGAVGTVFSLRKGALDIPAMAVGINVEAQPLSAWGDTNGGCAYEITMSTWAPNIRQNDPLTSHFLDAFEAAEGHFPMYTAASYDVLNTLVTAMEDEDSVNNEDLISWYEDPNNAQPITSGLGGYYPLWDYTTWGYWTSVASKAPPDNDPYGAGVGMLPALCATQVDNLYGATGYVPIGVYNYTIPPFTAHDLIYGPGYVTGIAFQWVPVEEE